MDFNYNNFNNQVNNMDIILKVKLKDLLQKIFILIIKIFI